MNIICIGRNYAEHIRELHHTTPGTPVFFLKPETSLLTRNRAFRHPSFSQEIHHEIELVLRISKGGKEISPGQALGHFDQLTLGIDFTARDLQTEAKKSGLPWTLSKGFDHSAPLGRFVPKSRFEDLGNIPFRLDKNGVTVQDGNSSLMLFPFAEIISYISRFITLRAGDLVFTGTPAGVGPVKPGDLLEGYLAGKKVLSCHIH